MGQGQELVTGSQGSHTYVLCGRRNHTCLSCEKRNAESLTSMGVLLLQEPPHLALGLMSGSVTGNSSSFPSPDSSEFSKPHGPTPHNFFS